MLCVVDAGAEAQRLQGGRDRVAEYRRLPGWNPYTRGGVNPLSHHNGESRFRGRTHGCGLS